SLGRQAHRQGAGSVGTRTKHPTGGTMKRWLILLFVLLPLCASARTTSDHAQWNADIATFEQADRLQPPPAGGVLFIVSSSILFWQTLASDFTKVHTINRGFGSSV